MQKMFQSPRISIIVLLVFCTISCTKKYTTIDPITEMPLYFPSTTSEVWDHIPASYLGWKEPILNNLYTYLESKGTKAFIVLKNGKLVIEKYFGGFGITDNWYWASAGKTMTAFLVGIAEQEGKLKLQQRSSLFLGTGWTSLPAAQEDQITIEHQLTMTTGLDDGITDADCTLPQYLKYKASPGSRWAYHNAPYTLLDKVIEAATGQSFNQYFSTHIKNVIGMNGIWAKEGYNNVYYSNARSMARFGLLLLAGGKWNRTAVLGDTSYIRKQVNSSQPLNPSYGYLTWLNGKGNYMLPTLQTIFRTNLIPNAPADLFAALGKNDQKLYVVPSEKLVIIRMGESANQPTQALSSFDNELWGLLKDAGVF